MKRKPGYVLLNANAIVVSGNRLIPKFIQDEMLSGSIAAYQSLRDGKASPDEWGILLHDVATGIALAGLDIGNNLLPVLERARAILMTIPAGEVGGCWICNSWELPEIAEALDMYRIQVSLCSQKEMSTALRKVAK